MGQHYFLACAGNWCQNGHVAAWSLLALDGVVGLGLACFGAVVIWRARRTGAGPTDHE